MIRIILYFTAFITGMNIMILELVASRILAPYAGTSVNVWASIIGIILASLSIGYYLGGLLADKHPTFKILVYILFSTFFSLIYIILFRDALLASLSSQVYDIRIIAIAGTILLFLPASTLFGLVSPCIVRLQANNFKTVGSTTGLVSALGTIGSILGTFLAGFILLAYFDISTILTFLCLLTLLLIFLFSFFVKNKFFFIYILLCLILLSLIYGKTYPDKGFVEINTSYNNVRVFDTDQVSSEGTVRVLQMGQEFHSMMYLHSSELASEYTKYYQLVEVFNPDFKKTLMIGGGAYSFPKFYIQKYPEATIDVVEIDPKLTAIAKQYFYLKDDPQITIYHEDGRVFLNNSRIKYDAIFNDAFSSYFSIPFQLTTLEAIEKMHKSLTSDGVVITNLVSSLAGEKSKFLQAEYATYKMVFPHVYIYTVRDGKINEPQNLILVASKQKKIRLQSDSDIATLVNREWQGKVENKVPILTDEFSPVDNYILSFQN